MIPEEYKADHLILLVGGNPMPNAVVGRLLINDRGIISLVHSKDAKPVADDLESWLVKNQDQKVKVEKCEVSESDPVKIAQGVQGQLNKHKDTASAVGINYTGGTKAMTRHACRIAERWAANTKKKVVFSYLDAKTQSFIFDPEAPESGDIVRRVYLGFSSNGQSLTPKGFITLRDLLRLHGWSLKEDPASEPVLLDLAQALLDTHLDSGAKQWHEWKEEKLYPFGERYINYIEKNSNDEGFEERLELPTKSKLLGVANALRKALGAEQNETSVDIRNAKKFFPKEPEKRQVMKFGDWLNGSWLEVVTLQALKECADDLELSDVYMSVTPYLGGSDIHFEVDVMAIRGHQLFAISCTTVAGQKGMRPIIKGKLFEVSVRARQLGGDEARFAVVCVSDGKALKDELRRTLDTKVEVFGKSQLGRLADNIRRWILDEGNPLKV
jgi:hypothetical protein